MVKSRYLCSAPRPGSWDEKAEALLKSLGGSALQQETMLRKTLDSLKVMHADKQKTGPGRKSNAEHAIAFYEYVLETITENKEGASSSSDASSHDADEVDPPAAAVSAVLPEVVPVKRKRGRPRKNPLPVDASNQQPPPAKKNRVMVTKAVPSVPLKAKSNNNPTPGSSDDDHSYSVASMDTAEFINQHNDLCEVCNSGGELLMCSTCNLVFHLQCVRPKMDQSPPDSWVCAYCIMSGVKGLKQNSKMRKNAAVAVRLMARMRKQLQRQKNQPTTNENDGDSDEQEPQPQTASVEGGSDASESASSSDAEMSGKEDEEKQQQQSLDPGEAHTSGESATAEESSPGDVEIEASTSEEMEPPAASTPVASATPEQLDEEQQPSPDDKNVASIEGKDFVEGDNADNNSKKVNEEPLADANGDSTEAAERVAASEAKASSQLSEASAAGAGDVTPQKSNQGMDDATLAAAVPEEVNSSGRVRRERKQANYYDPQSGPASHWKTDGANEWKYLSQHQLQRQTSEDDEVDDVDDGSSEGNAATGRRDRRRKGDIAATGEDSPVTKKGSKKSGKTWCLFCNDDKDIPVCCFCACRVCFGKHDQTQLLLCDNCDSEYHLSCLNPPLKSVPSSQSWFCPSCVEAAKQAKAKVGKRQSRGSGEKASTPKSAGRKPVTAKVKKATSAKKSTGKAKSPAAAEPPSVKRGPGRPRKHPLPEAYSGPPRKRGRPPKNKSPSAAAAVVSEPSISPPVKKRGRPRKNPLPETTTSIAPTKKRASSAPAPPTVKRGPGRPPKSASATKQRSRSPAPKKSEEKKKRAESKPRAKAKAVAAVKEEDLDAYVPTMNQSPVKLKSRTGRTVKRKSFHDEIDEGEQHLKSSRYAMQLEQERQNGYYPAHVDPVAAAAQLAAYADAGAAVLADGGIQHVPAVYAAQEHQHHDVDPHFLESIPVGGGDLSHVAHLDTLAMDPALNLDAMHQEAMQMEAAMNLNSGVGEVLHSEGDTKPGAVVANPLAGNLEVTNEVRPTPVVKSLSMPPSTNLETNKNPASLKTVADTATPAMGNTVPAVGVLTQAVPAAGAPKAETTLKPAPPAVKETGTAQAEKESAPEKEKVTIPEEKVSPSAEEAPAIADNKIPLAPAKEKVPPAAMKANDSVPAKETVSDSAKDKVPAPAKETAAASATDKALVSEGEKASSPVKGKAPVPTPAKEKVSASAEDKVLAPAALAKAAPFNAKDVTVPALSTKSKEPASLEDKKTATLPGKKPAPVSARHAVPPEPKPPAVASVAAALPQKPAALPHPPTAAASPTNTSSEQRGNLQSQSQHGKIPRRKPGARECMQISRRFGVNVIPDKYIEILEDYCKRGKVEHLIRMRERLDEHSRFLESQLAGLEALVQERGESDVIVPAMPESDQDFGE